MSKIRQAKREDLARIAETEVFNYRLNFYPIFKDDAYYFKELQVPKQMEKYKSSIESIWVYDDGVVKAISFYERHGFRVTDDKKFEDDTTEYLVRLER